MGDEAEQGLEIYIQDGVLVNSHTRDTNGVDFLNSLGSLCVVEYKSDLGKCIEWHQCDVSIESDDQEWAIVRDSKFGNGDSNENVKTPKPPVIQIPFKKIISFKAGKKGQLLTFNEKGGRASTTFLFQNGNSNRFVNVLKGHLNTTVTRRDLNLYIVSDGEEVHFLEKSFAELDLFSDDNTRRDAVWSFFKSLQDKPYEMTMCAFAKVTDALLYKLQPREMENVAELLNKSLIDDVTDCHTRISSEDYELISKRPPLPPRTLPLRSSALTADQWKIYFDSEGRIQQSELVKEIIFHGGISPSDNVRPEVWKFLLGFYPWNSTYSERELIRKQKKEEYFTMKLQWKTMSLTQESNFAGFKERKSLIEKDVYRTDRTMPYYAGDSNPNLQVLEDILMTYVMYNFDLGYVQGMSDLLSPLLVELNDEIDAFWCFVGFMNKVCRNFDLDGAGMKQQLQQLYCLLCCIEPELASYLELHDSSKMSFCFRWLLIWFKREFSFDKIYTLWEILWTEELCKNFHLLICAAILDTEKEILMSRNYGFTEILKHVNELAYRIDLDLILRKAEGIYYQLSTAAKIPSAVRELIGLPVLEPETPEPETNNCNGTEDGKDSSVKAQNGVWDHSTPYISVDPQETAFDNSLALQYL